MMRLAVTCTNINIDIWDVTWLFHLSNISCSSESLKMLKFPRDQGSGSRVSKILSPDTAGYFKTTFELHIWKRY